MSDPSTLERLAMALYDGSVAAHQLAENTRRLLGYAAQCYAAARRSGAAHPEQVARDIVLSMRDGLSLRQQWLAASAVAFQRDKLRRGREPIFLCLDSDGQETALRLAAVLRLATLLDCSTPRIAIEASRHRTTLIVDLLDDEAARLDTAPPAALWRKTIGDLLIRAAAPGEHVTPIDLPMPAADVPPVVATPQQLSGDELIAEGARRMLRHQLEKLLAREEEVRGSAEPEAIHQMRVATRRLRASLQVVESIYDVERIRTFRRRLRRIAADLGQVRDYDVQLGHITTYQARLPENQRPLLEPLISAIERRRAETYADLIACLDKRRYIRFIHKFARFLSTPGANVRAVSETEVAERVRDRAGSLIWRRYEELRAFEVVMPDAPDVLRHRARIAGKRLRYTLEFFAEALGPRVDLVMTPLVALQDQLGFLQDSVVAREYVEALGFADDPGALGYLAARAGQRAAQLDTTVELWEKVTSATYRRRLFELIVKL